MSDIVTERSGSILRVQLNRPAKKNAMTSAMYVTIADSLNAAAKDDDIRVVLWHGAGDSFCAGNDVEDFMRNPPGPGESPQAHLIGALRAAELIELGLPFDAQRAGELGLVTRVVPDQKLLATATETAQKLAEKPAIALQACKRLMRQPVRAQLEQSAKLENEEFSVRVRSADAKEAFTAFIEKRRPDFTRTKNSATAA